MDPIIDPDPSAGTQEVGIAGETNASSWTKFKKYLR